MKKIIYGCAYYDEYMPYERLEKDIEMMKKAGLNTVRIAESTWSTEEPHEGEYDFSHITKVMDAMEKNGIDVIIGTPTYAIPYWLAHKYPEVMADTHRGRNPYGARQLMDISNPDFRKAAERIIRKLAEITCQRKCVIGYQLDNETKHYDACNEHIQKAFVQHLREKFHGSLEEMNRTYGLDYWSNLITDWDVFPDIRGTINGSLACAFEEFQRSLVDEYLAWQAAIIREYKRPDQFITHNFDYEWRGYSYGVQPMVNHFHAAECLDITGCDIYHPTQSHLTGAEIAFGGDSARSLKQDNYIVLETQAQGFPNWHPYPGQLRLQCYAHLASGANGVNYWHWHSIHNSAETYWMGILGHDFEENDVYRDVCTIGHELERIPDHIVNLKKKNKAAVMVSNTALSALTRFPIDMDATFQAGSSYNDIVRRVYDTMYQMNLECDFITPEHEDLSRYSLIVLPALYAVDEACLNRLKKWTAEGGTLVSTFKTAYADENVKVYTGRKPHILHEVFGTYYHGFTFPENVTLAGTDGQAELFMEFLENEGCEELYRYDHRAWRQYAAITKNSYGKGTAFYIGTLVPETVLKEILSNAAQCADIELCEESYPLIVRKGFNQYGKELTYVLNFSEKEETYTLKENAQDLLSGVRFEKGQTVRLEETGVLILESE